MKTLFEIITALLYFNSVSPAFMYYIYDGNPNAGYVAAVTTAGPNKNRINSHKKYFIGSNNQKYMKLVNERAVDSHFTVQRTPSKPLVTIHNENYIDISKLHRNIVNSKQKITTQEDVNYSKHEDHKVSDSSNDNEGDIYQEKVKTTPSHNEASHNPNNIQKYNKRDFFMNSNNVYEKKANFVAINEHKAQVSKEQRSVNVKSNHQQPMRQSQKYHPKLTGPGVKDKILHKASTTNERYTLTRDNNDMIQKKSNINLKEIESKKRDTYSISDKVRKYINKDMSNYNEHKKNIASARIGNHEEIVDVKNTPYALFYRMNPEHSDEQEVLIESLLGQPSDGAYSDKMTWK